jgi:hypothetical protein
MKPHEINELKITNVTYVHEPDAMQRWLDLYVNLLKDALQAEMENFEEVKHNINEKEVKEL